MPYIAQANYAKQKDEIGNGECVALVRHLSGAGPAALWREGGKISDLLQNGKIVEGTVIATFVNGRYHNQRHGNHAALFVRSVPDGIEIFDQWRNHKPGLRIIRFGRPPAASASNRPENYSVVE